MTGSRGLEDFRGWVSSVLELPSSDPDLQVGYLRTSGVAADEMLLQFDDVLHVAHARLNDGTMSQEELLLLQDVEARVNSVSASPTFMSNDAALEEADEWRELRSAAKAAKAELDRYWNS